MNKGSVDVIQVADYVLKVYLPPSYNDHRHFPVVYMQDGGNLFLDTLGTIESLFAEGTLAEMVMIGIVPRNRLDEYTPWYSPALHPRYQDFGGQGAAYLGFLVQDIRPDIHRHYCILPERENTGIIGYSLGGLIAIYAGYLYPDIFGRIGSLSGSFWYKGFLDYLRSAEISHVGRKIYMDVGEVEGKNKSSIQRHLLQNTRQIPEILYRQQLSPLNFRFIVDQGVDHEYRHFMKRFPAALQWLF